jgi:hypothetical protein
VSLALIARAVVADLCCLRCWWRASRRLIVCLRACLHQWPKAVDQRPARCTGVAMSIAVSLLAKTLGWQGGRIVALTEPIRSHTDLQKDKAPFHKDASAFYKVCVVCVPAVWPSTRRDSPRVGCARPCIRVGVARMSRCRSACSR